MAALYPFEIHTPYRKFYADSVELIIVRLIDGDIGVYADHAFFIAPVCAGIVRIKNKKGEWRSAFTTEGILQVKGHKTVLMVDVAEWPEEIDYERALMEKTRAEAEITTSTIRFEIDKAKISLKRAEARIKAYELRSKSTEKQDNISDRLREPI
jgi:F-type H+-transporting ATPase subunit epsilon